MFLQRGTKDGTAHQQDGTPDGAGPRRSPAPGADATIVVPAGGPAREKPARPLRRAATPADPLGGQNIPGTTLDALRGSKGGGQPLPSELGSELGSALGHDLSDVRVHTGGDADRLARSVSAVAFTHGSDIYFSAGSYAPSSGAGQHLLAHELAHVAQQREGRHAGQAGTIGRADDPAETDADARAAQVVAALRRRPAAPEPSAYAAQESAAAAGLGHLRRAPEPVRRRLKVGAYDLGPDAKQIDRRPLMNEVDALIKAAGYVTTVGAYNKVHELIDKENTHQIFGGVEGLVNLLFRDGLLYKPARGVQLGPRTLGERPSFSGLANKIEMSGGQARRHVISSSTLGWAVENAVASENDKSAAYTAVTGFLGRQGIAGHPADYTESNLKGASRAAWELLHNHVGNLWLGPSDNNSVRGFIRGSLKAERQRLAAILDDKGPTEKISVKEIFDNVADARGPGMQRAAASAMWEKISKDLEEVLKARSVDQKGSEIYPELAISSLADFEVNADVDLPQIDEEFLAQNQGYLTEIINIYRTLVDKPTIAIFAKDAALDQYLKLDTGLLAKVQAAQQ